MSTDHYQREGEASARACAREYGITDAGEIAALAAQFAHDLRKSDELRELAA